MLLPPLPIILIFSGRLSRFQTWFPSRQSPIPTAEHCGRPLLHLVCSLRPLEWRWWGAEEGMGRGYQVIIVTGHIFWDCTATGEEWKNIVLCVCGSFGHQSWRELCVWLDASLAVLELNQCFNFILNQLEKRHIIVKTNVVTCNACDMTWLNAGLPVFGTGTVLAERVSALGIASQPAETGATIGPICKIKQTILSCTINTHSKTLTYRKTAEGKFHNRLISSSSMYNDSHYSFFTIFLLKRISGSITSDDPKLKYEIQKCQRAKESVCLRAHNKPAQIRLHR